MSASNAALAVRRAANPPAACNADDGGALSGPWWDAFCAEARAEAELLGLEVKEVSFVAGTLNVLASGGGVDDLQALNSYLSSYIDTQEEDEAIESLPPFLLEVSSPGLSSTLTNDIDFVSFKGFPVTVTTTEPFKNKQCWEGTLVGRDEETITINLKGRLQKIPRAIVDTVCLPSAKTEAGDVYAKK